MARPLLNEEIREPASGLALVISEIQEEGEPLVERTCAYRWVVRLEGNAEFPRVESVAIHCSLPSEQQGSFAIDEFAPKKEDEPGGSVTFQVGGGPSPVSLGVTIPLSHRVVEARRVGRNEILWNFSAVELDNNHSTTIEGVFSVTLTKQDYFELAMLVEPVFFKYGLRRNKKPPHTQPRYHGVVVTLRCQSNPLKASDPPGDQNTREKVAPEPSQRHSDDKNRCPYPDCNEPQVPGAQQCGDCGMDISRCSQCNAAMRNDQGYCAFHQDIEEQYERSAQSPQGRPQEWTRRAGESPGQSDLLAAQSRR